MNIVEFALRFKDMASNELRQFGTTARTTFANANNLAHQLAGHNRVLGQSYNALQTQIRAVENTIASSTIPRQIREARRELAALQRQASRHSGNINTGGSGSGSGGGMSGMLGLAGLGKFVGPAAILGVGLAAGQFLGESINKGLERQQIKTTFNVLTGSEAAGGKLTKQLVDLETQTILGSEVFQNAQTMMGFGFKDTEVLPNMKMLGDVSMGNTDKLGRLTLAFSQSRAAGKLMGQDLLQFISAGFNPLEYMMKRTGKTSMELRKDMEAGNISFAMVKQAFVDATSSGGKYNNMLETIGKTPAGMKAQIEGQWNNLKVGFGEAFMPLVSMALSLGSKLLPIIESVLTPLTAGVEQVVTWIKMLTSETGGWMGYVEVIRNMFTYGVLPVIQKVFGAVFGMVGSLVEFIGKSYIIKDIFSAVGFIFTEIFKAVGQLITELKWVFDNIVMPILNAIESAYRLITGRGQITTKSIVQTTGKTLTESTNTDLLGSIAQNTADNASASKNTEKAISGGGPRNIYITVQKFFDDLNINTTNLTAGENDIESRFMEMFARVVAQGALAQ